MAVWRVYGEMFRSINLDLLLEPVIHSDVLVTPHVLCEVNSALFGAKESYQLSVTQKEVYLRVVRQLECLEYFLLYVIYTFLSVRT